MSNLAESVKDYLQQELYDFWLTKYRAYMQEIDDHAEFLEECRIDRSTELPGKAAEAYEFYYKNIMQQDLGSVNAYTVDIDDQLVCLVEATTDGDDGWIEAYDMQGELIGAARRYIELLAWGDVEEIRSLVQNNDLPTNLDASATLWGKPLPEEDAEEGN